MREPGGANVATNADAIDDTMSRYNTLVTTLLRSPVHWLLSRHQMLVTIRGRRTERVYTIPVSYHEVNGRIHCFTELNNKWWHNLREGQEVEVTLRSRKLVGKPTVVADGSAKVGTALHDLLVAVPRDAPHSGVKLDADGHPIAADIEEARKRVVFISIEL